MASSAAVRVQSHPALLDGTQPAQTIQMLVDAGCIRPSVPLVKGQIQPSSLDLRLGYRAFRVRASFLPGPNRTVKSVLSDITLHEMDLSYGAVLETGCVYIVEILEGLALPEGLSAAANPKSSTGRLDVFTRVIADGAQAFDSIAEGYVGPLYAEISPKTFPILVRAGSRLSQIRFRKGNSRLTDAETLALHQGDPLVSMPGVLDGCAGQIANGVPLTIDLTGAGPSAIVGYRAKRNAGLIDVDRPGSYPAYEFWERIRADDTPFVLDPGEFYILASKEAVSIPPEFASEMVPFDHTLGELRVHYAGFLDPGFGHHAAGGSGARVVLEVRSRDVPFIVEDGQIIGRIVYERMAERPAFLYGQDVGSNYQSQGLKLSKHFVVGQLEG